MYSRQSVFLLIISLSAKGCPSHKGPKKLVFCDFPPVRVRSTKLQNVKTLRNVGDKCLGRTNFFSKSALAPGNCIFLFLALNFSKCPRPKSGHNPTKSPFPTTWGSDRKKVVPEKVAETIPDSVVTFFSISGPLLLWGSERALRG